jgi:hypothetical protein|eukprot:g3949.t1
MPANYRVHCAAAVFLLLVNFFSCGFAQHVEGNNGQILDAMPSPNNPSLARTPPMGWMSWQVFRCEVDCNLHPESCISERLFKEMTDTLVKDGFLDAGYDTISIDDCWLSWERDPTSMNLVENKTRFPSGMKALSDYVHSKKVKFGIYEDEGKETCQHYPGSEGFETIDANLFASWGIDYLKLDGCYNNETGFAVGYPKFGSALASTNRNITYSCSWPAYLGDNEGAKPFGDMIKAGCNLWRNWDDIQCEWTSLKSIIDHWGNFSEPLIAAAGPGHWNDPDMLIVGNDCITLVEGETQMAIWSIVAAPMIMGNDIRNLTKGSLGLLTNSEIIEINQDKMGVAGGRVLDAVHGHGCEVWSRPLQNGDLAVVLYNPEDSGQKGCALDLQYLKWNGVYAKRAYARDVIQKKDAGPVCGSSTYPVAAHGVKFFRLSLKAPSGKAANGDFSGCL